MAELDNTEDEAADTAPPAVDWRALWPLVGVFVIIQVWMWWPLLMGQTYSGHDIQYEHIPRRIAHAVSVQNGEAGFWFRWLHRGHSALFNGEAGVLHPLRWLEVWLLGAIVGFQMEMLLLHPSVLLGTLLYLRWRRCSWQASLFGAVLYTWGVDYVAHYGQVNHMQILAHMPLAALGWEACIVSQRKWLAAAGLAVVYASMLLLGHPQMTYLISLAVGAVGLLRGAQMKWSRDYWKGSSIAAGAVALGVLIGVVQLWPSVYGLNESARGAMTHLQRSNYSAHPVHFLQNAAPYLTKSLTVGDWFYHDPGRDFLNNPSEFYLYFGLGLLVFLYAGSVLVWRDLRRDLGWVYLGLAVGGCGVLLWLMTGKYGRLNDLLEYFPLVSQFRCPNRYKTTLVFLLAMGAAGIYDRLRTRQPQTLDLRQMALLALPVVGTVGIFGWSLIADGLVVDIMTYHFASPLQRALGPLICVAVVAGLVVYAKGGRRWALVAVATVCLTDLGVRGSLLMHTVPTRDMDVFRQAYTLMATDGQMYRVISDTQWPQLDGRLQANGFSGMPPAEKLDFANRAHLQLAGVELAERRMQNDAGEVDVQQIELPGALPRLRLVPTLRHVQKPLEDLVGQNGQLTVDLSTTALCTPDVAPELHGPPMKIGEQVEFIYDGGDLVRIAVTVQEPRLLLLSDTLESDWRATVDGKPRQILRIFDGQVRGVLVAPGDQEVTMRYQPISLYQGLRASLVGMLILAGLLLMGWRQERQLGKATDKA